MGALEQAIEMIAKQQSECGEGSPAFCVGEQLKDIIRETEGAAELVVNDLSGKGMGIRDCEKKIAEYARKNKQGSCGFCGQKQADSIIRKFYGIQEADAEPKKTRKTINIADFL